jgi:hypothetical protein
LEAAESSNIRAWNISRFREKDRIVLRIADMHRSDVSLFAPGTAEYLSHETRIPRIAIVGAGFVGSTTAYALMMSGMAAEIVLIDRECRRAEGHVSDLGDAEVFSHTTRVSVGDFSDCCSADVTVITAGVSQTGLKSRVEGIHETGTIVHGLVTDVCRSQPRGILLIASNPVDVMTYAASKWSGLPSNRVIGSGTSLDTSAFDGGSQNDMGLLQPMCTLMSLGSMAIARFLSCPRLA